MDIDELIKNMKFTENEVIFNKRFYEEVIMVSVDNAVTLKEKVLKFEDWLYQEWKKEKYSKDEHLVLDKVIDKFNELKKGM